jgi:hypothetical protein
MPAFASMASIPRRSLITSPSSLIAASTNGSSPKTSEAGNYFGRGDPRPPRGVYNPVFRVYESHSGWSMTNYRLTFSFSLSDPFVLAAPFLSPVLCFSASGTGLPPAISDQVKLSFRI